MELLPVEDVERLSRARKVQERIETKNREIEAQLRDLDGDGDNGDAYSDLSDPFSDMGESQLTPGTNKKNGFSVMQRMSKLESDTLLMSSFTPQFMRVQEEVLSSPGGALSKMYTEELGRYYDYLEDLPVEPDESLKKMMEDMLNSCRLPQPPPPPSAAVLESEDQGKLRGTASPDAKFASKSPMGEINETNSMSEVWRMLEAQSTSNGFPVSPIGYNAFFDDKKKAWLQREAGTWNQQEASRKKCEEWLKKL